MPGHDVKGAVEVLRAVRERLVASVPGEDRPVSLIADFHELLGDLGVTSWDADDLMTSSRLGTLARCSSILDDYNAVRRNQVPWPDTPMPR